MSLEILEGGLCKHRKPLAAVLTEKEKRGSCSLCPVHTDGYESLRLKSQNGTVFLFSRCDV